MIGRARALEAVLGCDDAAKASVDAALPDVLPGLRAEADALAGTLTDPEAHRLMQAFLDGGGQTAEVEGDRDALQALLEHIQQA